VIGNQHGILSDVILTHHQIDNKSQHNLCSPNHNQVQNLPERQQDEQPIRSFQKVHHHFKCKQDKTITLHAKPPQHKDPQKRHKEVPHILEIYIIEVNSQLIDFFVHAAKNTGYLVNKRLEHPHRYSGSDDHKQRVGNCMHHTNLLACSLLFLSDFNDI
jgi:hypothetical protein